MGARERFAMACAEFNKAIVGYTAALTEATGDKTLVNNVWVDNCSLGRSSSTASPAEANDAPAAETDGKS